MHDRTSACPVCGASPARGTAVLELDLGDDGHGEVAWSPMPAGVRRAAYRPRRRWVVGLVGGVAAAVLTANALAGETSRPTVLPATVTTTGTTTVDPGRPEPAPEGPLLGEVTGLSLVVLAAPDLAAVDLDTGRSTVLDTDLVTRSAGGPVVATSAGLAFVDRDGGVSVLAPGASTSRPVLVVPAGRRATGVLGEGSAGGLLVVLGGGSEPGEVVAVGPDGTVETVGVVPAGAAVRADGAGGAVVGTAGGVYRLVPGASARRLTAGDLLDAGWGRVLSLECDEALACAWQVLDPADGARWRVAVPAGEPGVVTLAPDGRHLVRQVRGAAVELVDATGRVVTLGATGLTCTDGACRPAMAWSADGRWLVGTTPAGEVWGWRDGLAGPVVADPGSPLVGGIVALTTRSAGPT